MWICHQYYVGGGDTPMVSKRVYKYIFLSHWTQVFRRHKTKIVLPFNTIENRSSGDASAHRRVLGEAPFFIKDQKVLDWAHDNISSGYSSFKFTVDNSVVHISRTHLELEAVFSDPNMAILFKLVFGGK